MNKIYKFRFSIIAVVIIVAFLIAGRIGWNQGYEEGLKESKNATEKSLDALDSYPLKIGNYWEYEITIKEQVEGGGSTTKSLKRVERVVGIERINEGDLITFLSQDYKDGDLVDTKNLYQLIVRHDVYSVYGKDKVTKEDDNLIYRFPLEVGEKWGTRDALARSDDFYTYRISQKIAQTVNGKTYDGCYEITYQTLADISSKIFCNGVGIAQESYKHNGTLYEWNSRLTKWEKAM